MENIVERMISIDFEDISNLKINYFEKIGLIVNYQDYKYEFIIHLVDNDDDIVVLGSSFSNKKQNILFKGKAAFARHSWYNSIEHNVIYYNDPTKYDFLELGGGWGIGTTKTWHLENIAKIVKKLADYIGNKKKLDIEEYTNLYFYGSSMGGFMSIMLSILIPNSTSIADSPQFNIITWWYWRHLKKYIFEGLSNQEILKYSHRLKVIDLIHDQKVIPNTHIIMDTTDDRDWRTQFRDFLTEINSLPYYYNPNDNKINIRFDGKHMGHRMLSKPETLRLIDDVIKQEKQRRHFKPIKIQMIDEFNKRISDLYRKYDTKNISFETFVKEKNIYFRKWSLARVDVKNIGEESNSLELISKDSRSKVLFPEFLDDEEGNGCTISSAHDINVVLKAKNKGTLRFKFKGPNYKDENNVRLPVPVCFKEFEINNELEFSKNFFVWHDKSYVYEKELFDEDILHIKFKFDTLNSYFPELREYVYAMDDYEQLEDKYKIYLEYINKIRNNCY